MSDQRHPDQPFVIDNDVIRFKRNSLVRRLLDAYQSGHMLGLNALVNGEDAPAEDWEQLYQLIGYSFSGYQEIEAVRDETIDRLRPAFDAAVAAHEAATGEAEERERAEYLRLKAKYGGER